jgi:hypothetical protein
LTSDEAADWLAREPGAQLAAFAPSDETSTQARASQARPGEAQQFLTHPGLDRSADYPPYEATGAFWEHNGFVQMDAIDSFPGWPPGNPATIYVAAFRSTP